jgi:hypothetical protein
MTAHEYTRVENPDAQKPIRRQDVGCEVLKCPR